MQDTTQPGAGMRAGRREWVGLAVLALPTLLLSLDMSVLYLALPHLSADLAPSSTQQLWIMDIYGFMIAGFLVTMGTLGDRIGRRRLLLIGASAFSVASVLAAYSTSAEMLIAARALMGVAGATVAPSTLALISNMFTDPRQRSVGIAIWMSCFMGGMAVGPLVGGVLLASFWWGSVFLLGVPVMVLLLVTAPVPLPEYRDTRAGRMDPTSVALFLAAILPVIYGIKELARGGWQAPPIAAVVAGAAVGAVFVVRQRRLTHPLLDLRLFANRDFSVTLTIMLVGGSTMGGFFLLAALYLQMVAGLSPLRVGLLLAPMQIAMIAASLLAPYLARKVRPGTVMAAGLAICAIGYLLLTQVDVTGGLAVLVAGFLLAVVGVALPTALGTDLIVGSAPPEKAGSASSVSETSGELGIALGVAVLGSIDTAVYGSRVVVPAGVSAQAAEAARGSITGAVSTAGQLPAGVATELLASARDAFTAGLNVAAGIGAVLFVALAAIAMATLRHVRPYGDAAHDQTGSVPATAPEADHDPDETPEEVVA